MALQVEKRAPTPEEEAIIIRFTEDRSISTNDLTAEVWRKNNGTEIIFYYLTEDPEQENIQAAITDLIQEFDSEDNSDDLAEELDCCYILIGQNLH